MMKAVAAPPRRYGTVLAAFDALIFTFAALLSAGTVYTAWDIRKY